LPKGVAVIIPALNEAGSLPHLLPILRRIGADQIIVADNGSTDGTADIALANSATLAVSDRQSYGAACWAGMQALAPEISIVAFIGAGMSDDPMLLPMICDPIVQDQLDLVVTYRDPAQRAQGAMSLPQRIGTALVVALVEIGWGYRFRDLGPMRAVRREFLERLEMEDRAFGWTVEMQIKAIERGGWIAEIPVAYRRRYGKSKISRTLKGVRLAAYYLLGTVFKLYWRRLKGISRKSTSRAF
jgi:glycosyltransferase involved in cell wall biosynthesis